MNEEQESRGGLLARGKKNGCCPCSHPNNCCVLEKSDTDSQNTEFPRRYPGEHLGTHLSSNLAVQTEGNAFIPDVCVEE